MLSYQHAYHAGNLADVHKHAMLSVMLAYLTAKDKPLTYLETHAGRGLYDLSASEAAKTGEAAQGIAVAEARRWFAPDHPYHRALAEVRHRHGATAYPGSPLIAALGLRDGDRATVAELCLLYTSFGLLGSSSRFFSRSSNSSRFFRSLLLAAVIPVTATRQNGDDQCDNNVSVHPVILPISPRALAQFIAYRALRALL